MRRLGSGKGRFLRLALLFVSIAAVGGAAFTLHARAVNASSGPPPLSGCTPDSTSGTASCTFKGVAASASFTSGGDASNCIATSIYVLVTQSVSHNPPDNADETMSAVVDYYKYDACNWITLEDAWGSAQNVDFQLDSGLSKGSSAFSVQATDYVTGATPTVTVSLEWHGLGVVNDTEEVQHTRSANYDFRLHYHGEIRAASASGTVSDGTSTVTVAGQATLYSLQGGDIQISRVSRAQ
jgi:hypothetical protein